MFDRSKEKHLYLISVRKTKNFLLKSQSREFLVFLFFLVIASGFWLLQTLDNEYESELTFPVKLRGVPEDVVITSDPVDEVKVTVKDRGTVLLNYYLRSHFLPIVIDFSDYQSGSTNVKVLSSDYERKILSQLSTSTRLLDVTPNVIDYIYTVGQSKYVPVDVRGRVGAARQFYISDTIVSPDSVLVYAPLNMLDTINSVLAKSVDLPSIGDTVTVNLALQPIKGAKFVPSDVDVTFAVDMYTEKTLEIPLVGVNFPAGMVLRTFPSRVQVTFQVGMAHFKDITAEDFLISVTYEELLKSSSDKFAVKFKMVPKGVTILRVTPENVDFLIEHISSSIDDEP